MDVDNENAMDVDNENAMDVDGENAMDVDGDAGEKRQVNEKNKNKDDDIEIGKQKRLSTNSKNHTHDIPPSVSPSALNDKNFNDSTKSGKFPIQLNFLVVWFSRFFGVSVLGVSRAPESYGHRVEQVLGNRIWLRNLP